jgi:hypothetical protein
LEAAMSLLLTKIITDTWVKIPWQEYLEAIADPNLHMAELKQEINLQIQW